MNTKEIYNLLTEHTTQPISLDTTGATVNYGPTYKQTYAHAGRVYYEWQGFDTAVTGAGFQPSLYGSFNGSSWFLHTALPSSDSAASGVFELPTLPMEFRLGWLLSSRVGLGNVRIILEADAEY